jgi:hypothetical protein
MARMNPIVAMIVVMRWRMAAFAIGVVVVPFILVSPVLEGCDHECSGGEYQVSVK